MFRRLLSLALILIMLPSFSVFAQSSSSNDNDLKYRKFRVSLVPGLSTNGVDAVQYRSRYSFNILAGYNGALAGLELGGLANINKFEAEGVQIAGLANLSGEETTGLQFAGLINGSRGDMEGIQWAGIANVSNGSVQGIQFSGVANMGMESIQGLEFAGVLNASQGDVQGLLFAGVANISGGNLQGLVFSGVLNYADHFEGIQGSTINITRRSEGIQMGVVNISSQSEGIQLGVINYADEFVGLPVGLISYYRNGRLNLDAWADASGFTNIGLKTGTWEIYNTLSIGYNPTLSGDVWQLGWTIGRHREYKDYFIDSDFSFFHINEGGWTDKVNQHYQYRVLFGTDLGSNTAVYAGPSLNLLLSKSDRYAEYAPYSFYDAGPGTAQFKMWIGLTAGIQFLRNTP